MRIGSLFSGAGGLDMAVEQVFGGEVIWQSEVDPAASKVLAHRFPCAPNLGDITKANWNAADRVDIICGGFPCQDVSVAGKQAGLADGTRSGLWAEMARIIGLHSPSFVVIENVRGLLSAAANRQVESDDADVGNGSDRPVLRALGAVLGDLADLGYDAQWTTAAASDIGAAHRRERVFILASNSKGIGWPGQNEPRSHLVVNRPESAHFNQKRGDLTLLPTPTAECGKHSSEGADRGTKDDANLWVVAKRLLPTPTTQDGANCGGPSQFNRNTLPLNTLVTLLPTPRTRDGKGAASSRSGDNKFDLPSALADPDLAGPLRAQGKAGIAGKPPILGPASHTLWGKYGAAIASWERIAGAAPPPTEPNRNGKPRLNPAFSEWMMGWPPGWVTDPDIGISRNDQLRIVGNGVCPQQATAALRYLLQIAVSA